MPLIKETKIIFIKHFYALDFQLFYIIIIQAHNPFAYKCYVFIIYLDII